jgi:hypothetical protein
MLASSVGTVACVPSPTPSGLSVWTSPGLALPGAMPNLPSVPFAVGSGWKSSTSPSIWISPSGEMVRRAPVTKLSWLRARGVSARSSRSGAVPMARFSMEMGRQKAPPMPGRGV